ncbi:GNAT family N-acetyltransferase [Shewanella sp. VB17]|uniref:GNAT family N-acetyltransferase n=1 Tax=Shewanella sp. VB17 TaxID=2739432 RepID=UPI001564175A|nr:GNAT family N-acetyltransferase [Shewanella sp. VB17]NRD75060.1 GNAT family N-acetyltransferase [Shewanella sp. VB17]
MLTIEKLQECDLSKVLKITLPETQIKFAETAKDFLSDNNDTTHLHVIKLNNTIVGFFKIDTAYSSVYDFCSDTGVGLRAFVIDAKQQGKGIGSNAVKALFPYLQAHYPAYNTIYLTVNCKNDGARRCYQKGGFIDTGDTLLGGIEGPQYIMLGEIKAN